ncbi:hypothetical protein [Paenibacillus sp. FSL L8-0158]|uniref:hypothetical protein n=1 Tax=Paenibacillus sp. FSL L8-0158 TaxID=2954752 RepID=UPI0031586C50
MAKMELNVVKESQETIANHIEGKILRKDEFETFRTMDQVILFPQHVLTNQALTPEQAMKPKAYVF